MGYTGGTTKNPTYHLLGDHTESVEVDYDPVRIGYARLLDVFWASHHPGDRPWTRQYRAVVFYHDEEQRREAVASRDRVAERIHGKVYTEILPAGVFYPAEGYHQKYALRNYPDLEREFRAIYPKEGDFVASTAVARVNGYVAGDGSLAQLSKELWNLGLSPAAGRKLWEIACRKADRRGSGAGTDSACPVR